MTFDPNATPECDLVFRKNYIPKSVEDDLCAAMNTAMHQERRARIAEEQVRIFIDLFKFAWKELDPRTSTLMSLRVTVEKLKNKMKKTILDVGNVDGKRLV